MSSIWGEGMGVATGADPCADQIPAGDVVGEAPMGVMSSDNESSGKAMTPIEYRLSPLANIAQRFPWTRSATVKLYVKFERKNEKRAMFSLKLAK